MTHNLNELKWGIVEEIEKLGYTPEIFTNPKGKPGLASAKAWNPRDADEIARRCVGAALLGMPRWNFQDVHGQPALLPTEYNHYEGALARTLGLPTLVLVQHDGHGIAAATTGQIEQPSPDTLVQTVCDFFVNTLRP